MRPNNAQQIAYAKTDHQFIHIKVEQRFAGFMTYDGELITSFVIARPVDKVEKRLWIEIKRLADNNHRRLMCNAILNFPDPIPGDREQWIMVATADDVKNLPR